MPSPISARTCSRFSKSTRRRAGISISWWTSEIRQPTAERRPAGFRMTEKKGVLFVPYQDTLGLLSVEDALAVCEEVYLMHARGSVVLSNPPSFKLDVADGFHNHWHVKSVFLRDLPATGVRLYNYSDDGVRNTVGGLGSTRYFVLSDPRTGEPIAIVDE